MDKMKNSGMSETMQTLTRKSACVMLSLLLLLSAVLPVKAAAETASAKVVRVGSFEDTFNYVNEKGARKGYGYELLETLSGYAGWQFEYVTCDWSDCFEKLKNGEIDIIGGISYTEDRTQEMLFSDEPMGVEKYYLYADLSRADISASDFKTLNGKKIGVLMGTEPAATAAGTAPHRCFSMSGSAWLCAFRSFSFFPIFLRPRRLHFDSISVPPISGRCLQYHSRSAVSSFFEYLSYYVA